MLIVERDGNNFHVQAQEQGMGTITARATNVNEVVLAVKHYFSGHINDPCLLPNSDGLLDCPFCRISQMRTVRQSRRGMTSIGS
jgi:hypothetical protein